MSESPSRRKFLTSLGGATAISLASYGHGRATFFPTAKGGGSAEESSRQSFAGMKELLGKADAL
jgi:hypothetical protein